MSKPNGLTYSQGILGGIIIGMVIATRVDRLLLDENRLIGNQSKVQQEYIAPSRIEVVCKDLDKSDKKGLPETMIKIGNKLYPLKEINGNPTLLEGITYEVQ